MESTSYTIKFKTLGLLFIMQIITTNTPAAHVDILHRRAHTLNFLNSLSLIYKVTDKPTQSVPVSLCCVSQGLSQSSQHECGWWRPSLRRSHSSETPDETRR